MDKQMIYRMRLSGSTYQEIADEFGLTRQRIHQIYNYVKKDSESYRTDTNYLAYWIKNPECFLCWKTCPLKNRTDCENDSGDIISFHWECWERVVFAPFDLFEKDAPS